MDTDKPSVAIGRGFREHSRNSDRSAAGLWNLQAESFHAAGARGQRRCAHGILRLVRLGRDQSCLRKLAVVREVSRGTAAQRRRIDPVVSAGRRRKERRRHQAVPRRHRGHDPLSPHHDARDHWGRQGFPPVSQKVKAAGRTLVGVGIEPATNRHWAHSCHEFRYYQRLVAGRARAVQRARRAESSSSAQPDAVELIRRAIGRLAANKGGPWVLKATIRPMVLRLDPTFDEKSYGASTFSELLKKHDDVLEVRKGQHDQEYRVREAARK